MLVRGLHYQPVSFRSNQTEPPKLDREHTVAILGSSKNNEQNKDFIKMAYEIANDLAKKGYNVVTGGCTGINEAANRGANAVAPGKSYAIGVKGWDDLRDQKIFKLISEVDSGPQRTNIFRDIAKYWVVFPGGPGTLEELAIAGESKYYNAQPTPDEVILMGKRFQLPLLRYLKNMNKMGLAKNAENSYKVADSTNEALGVIYGKKLDAVA